jgi:pimeloyl-ACP methyl ester carboxylesterase
MSALREGHVEAVGVASRLFEAGPEDSAEAVVFVHGNPGSASDWTALLGETGAVARAIAFDMPGFGLTAVPAGFEPGIESYSAFIGAALNTLGVERAHHYSSSPTAARASAGSVK